MSTVATRPTAADAAFPPRKLWTHTEYQSLITLGIIEDGSPYELIEGEIVEKMGQGRKHIAACSRASRITSRIFGAERVQSQAPISPDEYNVPEPDIAVLRKPVDDYMTGDPGPDDVVLVIEISATSLQIDRTTKAAIYARAGIADYWVMDVNRRLLYQHRSPTPDGYASITTFTEGDTIFPLAVPDQSISVVDLLPPQEA